MLGFLKDHPFAVEAYFDSSLVLTFAVTKENLQTLIPECLSLDTYEDKWGFIAVAMVQTRSLRPKGFPAFIGNDFFLIGYRVFVKYINNEGKRLRGLYIIRSETDKKKMEFFGNIFTHYNYTTTDISVLDNGKQKIIRSNKSNFEIEIITSSDEVKPPEGSPFTEWKEARRFAGPLPFTFTYNLRKSEVLIIEGVRENWQPRPVTVNRYHISFLDKPEFEGRVLANAFIVENIPYYWKKGKIEKWNR